MEMSEIIRQHRLALELSQEVILKKLLTTFKILCILDLYLNKIHTEKLIVAYERRSGI